jgi:hypothetical protein
MAKGSARDALSLLERIIDTNVDDAIDILNSIGYNIEDKPEIIELCKLIYGGTAWGSVFHKLKQLKDAGIESEACRRSLYGYGAYVYRRNK